MQLKLYQRVSLNFNLEQFGLKKGDVATLIDFVDHPDGLEKGCVLEFFNAIGESIDVITVPISKVSLLNAKEILSVRYFSKAG